MKNRINKTVASAVLIFLMISSAFLVFSSTSAAKVPAQISSVPSNMLQYEWPCSMHDPSHTNYNPGPGPSAPNIKWKAKIPNLILYPEPMAFNGLVFVGTYDGMTYALDGATGEIVWTAPIYGLFAKIDDTYMMIGSTCVKISDGTPVWEGPPEIGASLQYFSAGIGYVPELKMFIGGFSNVGMISTATAWNLDDPSKPPTLAWNITDQCNIATGEWLYGDGKAFRGSYDNFLYAYNATTAELLWKTPCTGVFFFSMCYYDGKVYFGGLDNNLWCWDADTGELLWTYNPQTWYGQWAILLGAAHGMIYGKNQDTYLYAINATTGKLVWRAKGPGIAYSNKMTLVGDKIYSQMGDLQYRDFETGENAYSEYNCYNALTGELIWTLPLEIGAPCDAVCAAYGNLYLLPTKPVKSRVGSYKYVGYVPEEMVGEVWCISDDVQGWSMFMSDPEHSGEGAGPTNLALKWKYKTDAPVYSSPAAANGVVYFGSLDSNIYAVNANTGNKIWNFTTGFPVVSSQAVVNGKVYTGADDGNIYCLNANTGEKIWETFAGGVTTNIIFNSIETIQCRSSPMVAGGKVYVGALDRNLYCLDANSGTVLWKFPTQGPIYVAPAVVDNAVYFPSTRGGYPVGWGPDVLAGDFYKLNATTGSVIWQKEIPYVLNRSYGTGNYLLAAPTVADGMVFLRNGLYENFALNATTGETIWTYYARFVLEEVTQAGGIIQLNAPLYKYGRIYMNDYYGITCLNAVNGSEIWFTWLSRENMSPALAYAYNRIYTVSELGVLYVLDSLTGKKLSYHEFGTVQLHSAPSLYNGSLFVGCNDWNLYCFGEARLMSTAASQAASSTQEQATSATSVNTVSTPITAYLAIIAVAIATVVSTVALYRIRKRK